MAQMLSMCTILPILILNVGLVTHAQYGAGYPESQLKSAKMG